MGKSDAKDALARALAKQKGSAKPAPEPDGGAEAGKEASDAMGKGDAAEGSSVAQEGGEVKAEMVGDALAAFCDEVEIEAVVGGALMRLRYRGVAGGTINPKVVRANLLALDPTAKVRDDFPMKKFGNRDTKSARAIVINARVTDSGAFIDLVCQNGDDLSVSVPKKKSPTFIEDLAALGRVGVKHLEKLAKAFDEKSSATIVLPEGEQFGVKYWSTDDGKHFLEGMAPEPPAAADGGGGANPDKSGEV